MELRVNDYNLPDTISFNFDELKTGISAKAEQYAHIVYTDDNIKAAKEDRADLNRLKKALNDERIRRQKEYMKPFDAFKAQIDEIISIIDKPVLAIDKQIKEYDLIKQDEKRMNIEHLFGDMLFPEFVKIDQIWNAKWLNATYTMKQIEEDLLADKSRITSECQTLASLPSYAREAVHFYQKTLSIEQSLAKVRELSEVDASRKAAEEAKKKAEEEAKRAYTEAELSKWDAPEASPVIEVSRVEPDPEEPKMWVGFKALLSNTTAAELKEFFNARNIDFRPIKIYEEDK